MKDKQRGRFLFVKKTANERCSYSNVKTKLKKANSLLLEIVSRIIFTLGKKTRRFLILKKNRTYQVNNQQLNLNSKDIVMIICS
jgi:hypothetical protein